MSQDSSELDAIMSWFRTASPYINAHRGKTLVLALPGECLRSDMLPTLSHDVTLLTHLGVRIVLCFGLRAQVDDQLAQSDANSTIVAGRRVTDSIALDAIISAAGVARHELEARFSMGLPNTPMAGARLPVSSGNYVTAQPFGIHNGIDFQHTGSVREVHAEAISELLANGHLVLLPPLGYSLTGDVFNVTVSEVAAACAIALGADKLVFMVDDLPADSTGKPIRQASIGRLESLLNTQNDCAKQHVGLQPDNAIELDQIITHSVQACQEGVNRVHLLKSGDPNALLTELFTRDGCGTLITANRWEHIRQATMQDVGGIIELIEPLQVSGSLIKRSREQLELDIENFVVSERDGMVVACAALYPDQEANSVEIACIATHPDYRGNGRAKHLLSHLEATAKDAGYDKAYLLSTQTGHWFIERGYLESAWADLPEARQASFNQQRNSRIYQKRL